MTDSSKLPTGWISQIDEETKRTYFVNTITGETQWTFPTEEAQCAQFDDHPPDYSAVVADSDTQQKQPSRGHQVVKDAANLSLKYEKKLFDRETKYSATHLLSTQFEKHKQKREAEGVDPSKTSSKLIATGAAVTSFVLDRRRARFERKTKYSLAGLVSRALDSKSGESHESDSKQDYGRSSRY